MNDEKRDDVTNPRDAAMNEFYAHDREVLLHREVTKARVENERLRGAVVTTDVEPPAKKARQKSRQDRWIEAAQKADEAAAKLADALVELRGVQEEFEEWQSNLPENLASSALGERLDEVCQLDVEGAVSACDDIVSTVSDCAGAELPRGFGRD